jgi:hypothetical protein
MAAFYWLQPITATLGVNPILHAALALCDISLCRRSRMHKRALLHGNETG